MIYGMVWGRPEYVDGIFYKNPKFSPEVFQPVLECGSSLSGELTGNTTDGPSQKQILLTVKSFSDEAGVPELAEEIMKNSTVLFNSKLIGQYINELVVSFPGLANGKSSEFLESNLYLAAISAIEDIKVSKPAMEEEYRQVIYYCQFWYSNYILSKLN